MLEFGAWKTIYPVGILSLSAMDLINITDH